MTRNIAWWVPNALSLGRIGLVPVWLVLALADSSLGAFVVLLLIGASDIVDGQLARRFHLATNLGATLDAVADKLATFVGVTFLAFFATPAFTPLPVWLWAGLLARDALLGLGYLLVWTKHRSVEVEHRWHGRAATFLLFVLTVAACLRAPPAVTNAGALLVLILVAPGTWSYLREGWRQLRRERA